MSRRPTQAECRAGGLAEGGAARTAIAACLIPLFAAACAVSEPPPGPDAPLAGGLARYGRVTTASEGAPLVVVLKDRHATTGAITRSRDGLYPIRRENRGAIAFLLAKGFDLLGCEAALGPLPTDDIAAAHRDAVREALEQHDDLDCLTVYQPIRYEIEFAPRLEVLGVEDPELYGQDVQRLENWIDRRNLAARNDVDDAARAAALQEARRIVREVAANTRVRGRRAAENLLRLAAERKRDRAALLIGGAHVAGVLEALAEAGAGAVVFEAAAYAK